LPTVLRTRQAEDVLLDIWHYVAQDNPGAADRVLAHIEKTLDLLARNPLMGPARPDLRDGLRYFASGRYLILYSAHEDGVMLVRVLHGARHLPSLL
jgi:toxin ParE1/3/4